MPVTALLLALAAALVHAIWNLLLSGEQDVHGATAVAIAFGAIVFAPIAILTWRLEAAAVPFVAGSSALEVTYLVLLATAYSVATMSFVYPIARGSAPVLVLAVSVVALAAHVSLVAAAGVVLVAAGIVLVRGVRVSGRLRDLLLALSVGTCIAGYTLVDKHGIVHGAPISYLELVFSATAAAYVAAVWWARGGAALRTAITAPALLAGVGFFGSYALTLAALRLAPAAGVAAVRETSVVIATAALLTSGRERVAAGRLAGAVAVVAGVALISLG
jgi:drug/metabolite transporter (DMT)-like permease